jgi:hypothetical protein
MSTNAGASGFKLYLGAETVWGTIVPTASVANAIRVTGGAGKTGTETMMSKEVSTYEASDVVRTRVTGGGSYNFELSFETADKGMDLVLGSVFGSAYTTNVMKVGNTLKFFSLTEKYSDLATPVIREYAGCVAESYRLDIRPGDAITGSFSFVSKKEVDSTTMTMVTPAVANTNAVMNPLDSIQTLKWGGASVVGCTAFSMEFRRPVIQLPQLSSVDPTELLSGTFEASGSMSLYLQNTTAGLADYSPSRSGRWKSRWVARRPRSTCSTSPSATSRMAGSSLSARTRRSSRPSTGRPRAVTPSRPVR